MFKKMLISTAVVALVAGFASEVEAKRKHGGGPAGPPSEQTRQKAWENGMKNCRAKYGSLLKEVHVEKYYGKWSVVCYIEQ